MKIAGDPGAALNAFSMAGTQYWSALGAFVGGRQEQAEVNFKLGRALFLAGDVETDAALEETRDALTAAEPPWGRGRV